MTHDTDETAISAWCRIKASDLAEDWDGEGDNPSETDPIKDALMEAYGRGLEEGRKEVVPNTDQVRQPELGRRTTAAPQDGQQEAGAEPPRPQLRLALTKLLNTYGAEQGSDTPDFMLANYLVGCLGLFDITVKTRTRWYTMNKEPTR